MSSQPDGKIVYAYKFQLRQQPRPSGSRSWCDAATGKVIQAVDFATMLRTRPSQFLAVIPLRFQRYPTLRSKDLLQMDGLLARYRGQQRHHLKSQCSRGATTQTSYHPPAGHQDIMNMFRVTVPITRHAEAGGMRCRTGVIPSRGRLSLAKSSDTAYHQHPVPRSQATVVAMQHLLVDNDDPAIRNPTP
ncbi:hypothetical protein BASA60_002350 [Batrachochytrium salamandrivorans]|nr:hypothetical protein BASA60_002350 [Batrachochytrium salamandrivorans]